MVREKRGLAMSEKKFSFLRDLLSPVFVGGVVGVVVLLGPLVIQPLIVQKAELLKAKQEAYWEAICLVNQHYRSRSWVNEKMEPQNKEPGPTIETEKVDQSLAKLRLVENNENVSKAFLQCFGIGTYTNKVSNSYLVFLINAMRIDLYGKKWEREETTTIFPFYLNISTNDLGPAK